MKKLLVLVLMSGFMVSLSAAELGEKDSRCLYTKCEMDRTEAQNLNKTEAPKKKEQKGSQEVINS